MLKRYATFFAFLQSIIDVLIIALIWTAVYYIRFYSGLFSTAKGIPPFKYHVMLMLPVVGFCYLACLWSGLYKSERIQSMLKQGADLLKATLLSGLLMLAFLYYVRTEPYSRKLLVVFVAILYPGLSLSHLLVMALLRYLRKKGYNQRHYVVIGAGKKGQQLVQDIEHVGWTGLKCSFFVDNNPKLIGAQLLGVPVYGPIEKILDLVKTTDIDEVYFAPGGNQSSKVYPILERLQSLGITIRIIPDWGNLVSISTPTAIPIGSQLLFSAGDSPLVGFNIILKEVFDRIVALTLLIMLFIPMLIVSLLIKLTSKGQIFYKQTRVGMDQKTFEMFKFRTMRIDAEKENGPQWAKANDFRCTRIGRFLRKTSIDELPQLINIAKGQMSLVGPRPERPYFVKKFSANHRRYMLRHKVKAGMTGWAQVNGFRGDTSLRKRVVYDLYYVRKWSIALDLWILLRTPWSVIKGKNAH
jgi:exopolysaccharide biosynthesis polyprenyl glycosylphosphotransferase